MHRAKIKGIVLLGIMIIGAITLTQLKNTLDEDIKQYKQVREDKEEEEELSIEEESLEDLVAEFHNNLVEKEQLTPQQLMDLAAEKVSIPEEEPGEPTYTPSRGGVRKRVVQARVTAYAPLDNKSGICAEGDPTITATGTKVRRGIIAVDPKKIPYGTKVYIPGYGEAIAEDTGGALRNYDGIAIDILVDTYEEAMQWGKRYMEVIIYEEEE